MIQDAVVATLSSGIKTRDLGGSASTSEFTDAIIERLHTNHSLEITPVSRAVSSFHAPDVIDEEWVLHGADVFVEHRGLPPMPESIGPFTLRLLSNRGTKVWPGPLPDILLVDHFRCRYISDDSITREDVLGLLNNITAQGFQWCHVELLNMAAGQARYSKAQGE